MVLLQVFADQLNCDRPPAAIVVCRRIVAQRIKVGHVIANGSERRGLLQGKKATILVASGGVYEAGTPASALNFIDPYLKTVFGFIGVTDVKFVTASGAARVMMGAVDRATFLKPTLDAVRTVAA